MSQPKDSPLSRSWKVVAGVAVIIGAIASITTIAKNTHSGREAPALVTSLDDETGALRFQRFLMAHDEQVVYLDTVCHQYVGEKALDHLEDRSRCVVTEYKHYSGFTSRSGAFNFQTYTAARDARQWWRGSPDAKGAYLGVLWAFVIEHAGSVDAGLFDDQGAGTLAIKGNYMVHDVGPGTLGPPVVMFELTPVATVRTAR